MATVVKTFDLYNTTFYWKGYSQPGYTTELSVAQAYYTVQYSSNPIGSQIDFFSQLANSSVPNPSFNLNGINLTTLPYLWSKYWWDEAMYYTNNVVLNALTTSFPFYYQSYSEVVGSLYYVANAPYNILTSNLLIPGLSDIINKFYSTANSLFNTNISKIGPTTIDTDSAAGNLTLASTDLSRRVAGTNKIVNNINSLYPILSRYSSFNNNVVGNLITPYSWTTNIEYEDTSTAGDTTITVDMTNTTASTQTQLTTKTLQAINTT